MRFIPAGAGNTQLKDGRQIQRAVYPRWRGEHDFVLDVTVSNVGLSPLARGTHVRVKPMQANARFIPAGAGNTNTIPLAYLRNAVYPRWRGEHVPGTVAGEAIRGLSPLARGTPSSS